MDINEVRKKVKKFLTEEFEIEEEKIKPDADLKSDLGIDSLDFVDFVVVVEDVFGFKITAEELKNVTTYDNFCDFIYKKVSQQ